MDIEIKSESNVPCVKVQTWGNEQVFELRQKNNSLIILDMAMAAKLAIELIQHIERQAIKHKIKTMTASVMLTYDDINVQPQGGNFSINTSNEVMIVITAGALEKLIKELEQFKASTK